MKEAGFTDVRTSINRKQKTVRAIHCNATASRPVLGNNTTRQGEGDNEVVGPEGSTLEERKSEGGVDENGIITEDRHRRGGDAGLRQWGKRLEWGGMEWIE